MLTDLGVFVYSTKDRTWNILEKRSAAHLAALIWRGVCVCALSSHHVDVDSGSQTQVGSLSILASDLYPLSHLVSPRT